MLIIDVSPAQEATGGNALVAVDDHLLGNYRGEIAQPGGQAGTGRRSSFTIDEPGWEV